MINNLHLSDKVRNWYNSIFHNHGNVVSSGTFEKQGAAIIHLENMNQHEIYHIKIKDLSYAIIKNDKNHIWIIQH